MSKDIETEVWNHAPVCKGNLLVLLALADNADKDSRLAWPGITSLARRARLSERQARRCIKELKEAGLITIKPNASPLKTNLYCITPTHLWKGADDVNTSDLDNMSPPQNTSGWDTHVLSDRTPTAHQIGHFCNSGAIETGQNDIHGPSDRTPTSYQIGHFDTPDRTFLTSRWDTHVLSDRTPMSPKPSGEPSVIEPSSSTTGNDSSTKREEILIAAGHDKSGVTATGRIVGNAWEMQEVDRWRNDLGLSQSDILTVVRDVMKRKTDGPPNSLKYFTEAMKTFAAGKNQPQLQAIDGGRNGQQSAGSSDRIQRIIAAAARGTSGQDWG